MRKMMMTKAILFDIDGTLIKGGNKTHREAFKETFREIYGKDADINEIKYSGKTDKRILVEVLQVRGIPEADIYEKLEPAFKFMEKYFEDNSRKEEVIINSGIEELLTRLSKRNHILGILSGNLPKIGWLKIKYAGLRHLFILGSFGNLSEDRVYLVEDSIRKIQKINPALKLKDIYVVGDTPHDIECGNISKVKTIAVATGRHPSTELRIYHPTYLFEDFSDTDTIIRSIEKD